MLMRFGLHLQKLKLSDLSLLMCLLILMLKLIGLSLLMLMRFGLHLLMLKLIDLH